MKNYIWDFDGMLFDSYPHIVSAFEKMMLEYGQVIDKAAAQKMFEIKFSVAYDFYKTNDEQKALFREYEHDQALEPIIIPFKNTKQTLKKIVKNGGVNYLYTHRGESAFYYLKKYELYDLFTDFITSEDGFPLKPSPQAVTYLVEKYNMNPSQSVMIGDREIDVLSGKNAGIKGCLFTKEPKTSKADYIIDDIIQVLNFE